MKLWRSFTSCLRDFWLDLVVSWHADRAEQLREDQKRCYRAIYRIQPFMWSAPEPVLAEARAHCVNCGHRGSVLVSVGAEPIDVENEVLDMLECPVCGLYTMCSD